MELYYIGIDGKEAISSLETKRQIREVESLDCLLEYDGKTIEWKEFNDPENEQSLFQRIIKDKEERVDKQNLLDTRPNFCVISVIDNKAVRLEYYEGTRSLSLTQDYRIKDLQGKRLPQFMEHNYLTYLTPYLEEMSDMSQLSKYTFREGIII